jgi:hypothetical protein
MTRALPSRSQVSSVLCARRLGLSFAVALLALYVAAPPAAAAGPKALRCAVESSMRGVSPPKALCEQLGQALGRPMPLIPDARKETKGDAVQIMHDDVQWTLVLLRKGAVRSWTRVSAADARGREVVFFARALRSLLQAEPKAPSPCVRLEPKNPLSGAFDLVYPWEELKPCERRVVEVPDPWWGEGR